MSLFNINWPINPTTVNTGPVEFQRDGVTINVSESTITPSNSRPLPAKLLDANGNDGFTATNTLVGPVTETAPATDTASSGLNGRLQRIAQRLTSLIALFPTSIGQKTSAGSLSTVLASDATLPLPTGASTEVTLSTASTRIGDVVETAPATDTASSGLNGRLQRIAQRLTSLIALLPASLGQKLMASSLAVTIASDQSAVPASQSGTWNINNVSGTVALPTGAATDATLSTASTRIGDVVETAPATDTASSGLNGRLQRVAQRLTSLIALFPSSIGQKTKAGSLSVALASDDDSLALLGPVTETAPATDTASSGHNGRLQRIAQRLTSLISLLPSSLGQKTMANSLAVVVASDQSTIPVSQGLVLIDRVRLDYSSTNVTTSAYTQLIASTAGAIKEVEIFDSSGSTMVLATGAAASEVDKNYVFPGGNGRIPMAIAASTRLSVKAISANATTGEITINLYG